MGLEGVLGSIELPGSEVGRKVRESPGDAQTHGEGSTSMPHARCLYLPSRVSLDATRLTCEPTQAVSTIQIRLTNKVNTHRTLEAQRHFADRHRYSNSVQSEIHVSDLSR